MYLALLQSMLLGRDCYEKKILFSIYLYFFTLLPCRLRFQ